MDTNIFKKLANAFRVRKKPDPVTAASPVYGELAAMLDRLAEDPAAMRAWEREGVDVVFFADGVAKGKLWG